MEEPIISPDFTVEDIHKLREYNHARRINMKPGEVIADIKEDLEKGLEIFGKKKETENKL